MEGNVLMHIFYLCRNWYTREQVAYSESLDRQIVFLVYFTGMFEMTL